MSTYPIILEKAIKITINNLNTKTCSNSFDNYISHRDTVNINCEAVAPPCLQLQETICFLLYGTPMPGCSFPSQEMCDRKHICFRLYNFHSDV